ncbi:Firmicu-CTERM sorting domain-containing protein [Enterococcus asini]|uniref:Firmicu-CTERM sorting domain-containing protein n=1 Tax=Enterococcus asini TaxID=57732 RepID=UPI0032E4BC46
MKTGLKIIVTGLLLLGVVTLGPTVYAATNGFGITIDGNFDDWADKPKTEITSPGDDFNIKEGALLADTTNIYFYLSMSAKGVGYNNLQTAGYKLVIAGKTYYLTFSNEIGSGSETTKEIGVSAWCEDNGQNYSLPNAKIIETRNPVGDGYSDMVEFSIPYGDLGLDSEIVNEIALEISNPNLGSQTITTTGGSTGPYLLAGVGLVAAVGGILLVKKRAKAKG